MLPSYETIKQQQQQQQQLSTLDSARAMLPNAATLRLIVIVAFWYTCSSLTNNIGKTIFDEFRYPISLTVAQFGFVAVFAYIYTKTGATTTSGQLADIIPLSNNVLKTVGPLAFFNIAGHVLSAVSISRVSVSLAHTIKALSPLFTVVLSTVILKSQYSPQVYLSLIPLTFGVILACVSDLTFDSTGLFAALASSIVFVLQNLFSKKIFNDKWMDELNLLFYSSVASLVLLLPMWIYYDGIELMSLNWEPLSTQVIVMLFMNGVTHFGQNIFAFSLMTLVSPVTYSVASLLKRVFIIVVAIVYFGQGVSFMNLLGLILTFSGLHFYNQAKVFKEHDHHHMSKSDDLVMDSMSDLNGSGISPINSSSHTLPRFYSSTSSGDMLLPPMNGYANGNGMMR